jgi:hypothetical protein
VIAAAALGVLAGCGAAANFAVTKPDMTAIRRDDFDCRAAARTTWYDQWAISPLLASRAQKTFDRLYRECMEIRGYTVTEAAAQ